MSPNAKKTRDPNRARAVLVHPQIHKILANRAREEGYSIQDRLHVTLCNEFDRADLLSDASMPVAAAS